MLMPFNINYRNNDVSQIDINKNSIYYRSEKLNLSKLNDPLFKDSEYQYKHSLASQSLELAISAFSSADDSKTWGDNTHVGRDKRVKALLAEYGFSDIQSYGYNVSLNDTSSNTAFAVGFKPFNNNTSIVAIAVRGGGYGLEWADNFNIGTSDNTHHKGFYTSASRIKNTLDDILPAHITGKKVKLWITGYSRGGAVANILAAMYNRDKDDFPCEVYAYTFATPKTVDKNSHNPHSQTHDNIINIVSPNDPIYNIPPKEWGFSRYGRTATLPLFSSDKNPSLYDNVSKSYTELTGTTPDISDKSIKSFMNVMIKSSQSRDWFSQKLSVPISELLIINMQRYEDGNGNWVKYSGEEALRKLHGDIAVDYLKKLKKNDFLSYISKFGLPLPDNFYYFITLCHMNGFDGYQDILFSNLNAENLNDISSLLSQSNITTGHRTEFYQSLIKNISDTDISFSYE